MFNASYPPKAVVHYAQQQRVYREVYIAPNAEAVSRMVFARQAKEEAALIASATIEDGKLIVWSCEPRRYAVAASEIPASCADAPVALAVMGSMACYDSNASWPQE